MCGIVGYIGEDKKVNCLLNNLERLEYRGYDSAGVGFLNENSLDFEVYKSVGKIALLKEKVNPNSSSNIIISHTRWATHGMPSLSNSHPHRSGKILLVHNGIIENYEELKKELPNYKFYSDTDTEILAAIIAKEFDSCGDMKKAIYNAINKVKGSYSLLIMQEGSNVLYGIRRGIPLILGFLGSNYILSSDISAFISESSTQEYYIPKEDVLMEFQFNKNTNKTSFNMYNNLLQKITLEKKDIIKTKINKEDISKQGYDHFMLKEIHEEPNIIKNLINKYIDKDKNEILMPDIRKYSNIHIIGCGSAYHAGLIGKYYLENLCDIKTEVFVASEYRYNKLFIDDKTLVIAISQSGETADTLQALKIAKENSASTLRYY